MLWLHMALARVVYLGKRSGKPTSLCFVLGENVFHVLEREALHPLGLKWQVTNS